MFYFAAFGASAPVLPEYVRHLGGSDTMVGFVVGSFALTAVVARPLLGRLGDRRGRRLLLISGALLTTVGYVGHAFTGSVGPLVVTRLMVGVGQGAVMIGGTALAVDLSPIRRRGEAASYVLVAFQLGLGLGPLLGEALADRVSYDAAWYACAATTAVSAAIAWGLPRREVAGGTSTAPRRLVHPAGLRPGVVIGLGMFGFAGFSVFVPLFGEEIGVDNVAPVFLLLAGTTVVVRLVGARVPDRLGPVRGGVLALSVMGSALIAVGIWQQALGLYLLTIVAGAGAALLFPSLVIAAVAPVPENERSAALATFTMFVDAFAGLGGLGIGWVAEGTSYAGAFIAGGLVSYVAVAASLLYLRPYWRRYEHAVL